MIKRTLKKGLMLIFLGIFLTMGAPVMAGKDGPDADAYMTVIRVDPQTRISVKVPTIFAFVVNGTLNTDDQTKIAVSEKTLLLPNVKVNMNTGTGKHDLVFEGSGDVGFENYSTTMEETVDGTPNTDASIRRGLDVNLNGYIENTGTSETRKGWNAQIEDAKLTTVEENFKNYRLSLGEGSNSYTFNKQGEINKIWLNKRLVLEKPIEADGYDTNGLAKTPSILKIPLNVEVGGYRGQYNKVEASVKAGKIIWTVEIK